MSQSTDIPSATANRRLVTLQRHLTAASDLPDIGVNQQVYDHDRLVQEATSYILNKMTKKEGREEQWPLLSHPVNDFGTVTRGNPPAHLLNVDQLPGAGLTPSTWSCDVDADPYVEPPHVRVPATMSHPTTFNLQRLKELGQKYGTVKVMKAMQCLNVQSPLGQGIFEGVPLSIVLRHCCGKINNVRRIYYWGYHNNDPQQIFRSSISYTEAFEHVPNEPPIFLAYKLNGKPLPLIRGGPVRMIVPFGYGFKNVKFLQHIRMTNDYRPNDTYAAIDEGVEGNDPNSIQKTYVTVNPMIGSSQITRGGEGEGGGEGGGGGGDGGGGGGGATASVMLSGVLMNGRTPAAYMEYWVRKGSNVRGNVLPFTALDYDDPELMHGNWIRFEIPLPPSPRRLNEILAPANYISSDLYGFDGKEKPKTWPLPFSFISWNVEIPNLLPGVYEIRARAVDISGNKQPEPRPYRKNGRNEITFRTVHVQ